MSSSSYVTLTEDSACDYSYIGTFILQLNYSTSVAVYYMQSEFQLGRNAGSMKKPTTRSAERDIQYLALNSVRRIKDALR